LIVGEPNRNHPSNQERMARIGGSIPAPFPAIAALADDELHIPAAIVSDAAAKAILALAGATPSELQSSNRPQPEAAITLPARHSYPSSFPQFFGHKGLAITSWASSKAMTEA